ncbi:MAG: hypothetical protein QNJ00_00525 [Woeseiaceae bacterium]|nr:hypothetical protein [Woeseiaceae bacterium]
MTTSKLAVLGARFMLATTLASFAAFSQEVPDDELAPAVDTSADSLAFDAEPAVDTSADSLEPAVDTSAVEPDAVVAQQVSRSYTSSGVMDRMDLASIEITGNQELPTVMYIVPWQKAAPGDLMGKPVNTLLDEVLAPIDREEFVRVVDYYGELYGEDEE